MQQAEGQGCVTRVRPSACRTSSIVRCLDPESAGFATWRWAVLRPRTLAASLRDILRAAPSYIGIGIFHELKLNHTVGSLNFSERTGSVARRRYKIFLGRQCVSLPQAAGAGVSTRSSTSHGAEACGVGADAVTAHSCHLLAWLFSVSLVVFSLTSSGSVYHGHVNCRSVSWRR